MYKRQFEENGISFEHVPSGIDTMTVFVHQDEFMHKEQKVVAGIHRLANPDTIDIESDLASVSYTHLFRAGSTCSAQIFAPLPEREAGLIII